MPILLDPTGVAAAPAQTIPQHFVELDLGNYLAGGIWDDPLIGQWDTTFVWGPVTPTYPHDISAFVREGNIQRGTARELQRASAGLGDLLLDNLDGRFTPFLPGPYFPNVKPMRRIRIRAFWNGVFYPVAAFFVENWPVEFPEDTDQVTRVRLVDGLDVLAGDEISGDFPEQGSGARVAAVLAAAGWLATETQIDAGVTTVPAITLTNVSPLNHIQDITYAEGGRFFIGKDGKARFRERSPEVNVDLSTRTWADDGTGMSYLGGFTLPFDKDLIVNDVRLSRTGGVEQIAVSQVSQDAYGSRSAGKAGFLQTTDIQLSTDVQVLSLAEDILARFSEPQLRFENLTDNAMRHGFWDRVLAREIGDSVNVIESRTQTAQVSTIEGITHDFGDNQWRVTFSLSPTTVVQAGVWDDPDFGQWDETFIWAR